MTLNDKTRNSKLLSLIAGTSLLALSAGPALAGSTSVETKSSTAVQTDAASADAQTGAEIKADLNKAGEAASDTAKAVGDAASDAATAAETKVRELLASNDIDSIEGTAVRDANGNSVGEVDGVVRSRVDDELFFVTDVGGFLGLGEREVAIPADEFTRAQDHFILASMTKEQLENRPEYDASRFVSVAIDATGSITTQ